jgi:threonine dehydrogenase-like Zn-dependent dehydrogenase
VGLGSEPVALDFDRDLIMTPRTVVGSRTFSIADLAQCAELVIDRHVPIERIVSHRYQLQDVADAYRRCDTQAAGKIIVTPTA